MHGSNIHILEQPLITFVLILVVTLIELDATDFIKKKQLTSDGCNYSQFSTVLCNGDEGRATSSAEVENYNIQNLITAQGLLGIMVQ